MNSPGPVGVLLAGGQARRMGGGDKPLLLLGGRSLLARAQAGLAPQCSTLVLSGNGDPVRFAASSLPAVSDTLAGYPGPLAGILAGMRWAARHRPEAADILTLPADTPFPPADLATRLAAGRGAAAIACARSAGRLHPAVGLWPVALADRLEADLRAGMRRVAGWAAAQGVTVVDFPLGACDPFLNINTPEDLAAAERLLDAG